MEFFKTILEEKSYIDIKLKNGTELNGRLIEYDKNHNIVISNIKMIKNSTNEKYYNNNINKLFIRGNQIKYISS